MTDTTSYQKNADFWNKTKPKILSDILVKPAAVALIGKQTTPCQILDAGCGSGFVTRLIKQSYPDSRVYGCDNSDEMLQIAQAAENQSAANIMYQLVDVKLLSQAYALASFDFILSISVLLHFSLSEYQQFLQEAHKTLKLGGRLIISTLHPYLFSPSSPTRSSETCWVKHFPLEDKPQQTSQKFKECLYDINGNEFVSTVWHHSLENLVNSAVDAGFKLELLKERFISKEELLSPSWGNATDYPAYLQLKLVKAS